jgi:hypothetical protein
VPSLADYCVVFLPTADGKLCASALSHADPARARKLAALRDHPVPAAGPPMSQTARMPIQSAQASGRGCGRLG